MLTDERYKQLMEQVGLPNSLSLLQALQQCAMEVIMQERDRNPKERGTGMIRFFMPW